MAELITDWSVDFLGGQDASRIPDRIEANCYAAGINTTTKKVSIGPRWAFDKQEVTFPDGYILDKYSRRKTYRNIFESGKFQAAAPYYIGNLQYILFVVAGHIFVWNPDSNILTNIEINDGPRINARAPRINWSAAGKYFILYDYPAFPVIIEGLEARRADPLAMEIPVSTNGAFNQSRLIVANNGNEYTGGDPVGSIATPSAPITFEEVFTAGSPYLSQVFQLPTADHNDPITYMGFLPLVDSSTGVGPLVLGTQRAIYTANTQNPRSEWDQKQLASLICYNAGIVGPRAFTNVNSDAFFISADGYARALSMSREEQHRWSRVPVSREVENWFKYWDRSLAQFAIVGAFNNKIFFSVNPYRVKALDLETNLPISDYAHGGFAVMELDNITSMGQASKPTWAGLWTGVRPMEIVNLGTRAFVISKDGFTNAIYEINPEATYDSYKGNIRFVRSRVYTKEHDFKDAFANKEAHSLDFNFDSIQGDFEIDVKFKPSHSSLFIPWKKFEHKAPWRTCEVPSSCFINGFAAHVIRDLTLGAPLNTECNPVTGEPFRVFRKVQLQFTLKGKYWEIHEYRIKAIPKALNKLETVCEPFKTVGVCLDCNDDWVTEEFESCQKVTT
mgnify:CR=1 FL=1